MMSGLTLNPPNASRMIHVVIVTSILHGAFWFSMHRHPPMEVSKTEPLAVEVSIAVAAPSQAVQPVVMPEPVRPQPKPSEVMKVKPVPKGVTKAPPPPVVKHEEVSEKPVIRETPAAEASGQAENHDKTNTAAVPALLPPTAPSFNADYLRNPPPVYPQMARHRGWEGRVVVKVLVSAEGKPVELRIEQASDHESLDEAAMEAIKQWHFKPATRAGKPVQAWVLVPMDFKLSK